MKFSFKQNIKFGISKLFFNPYVVIACFILLQIWLKLLNLEQPSDDFKNVYWNNANNIQPLGYEFESLGGKTYIADGNIERFGYMPYGYIYLIAAIIKLGGGLNALFFANVLLLAITIFIAQNIFKLITSNKFIIYLSLWLLVINPLLISIPRLFLSEGLFSFLTISSLYYYIASLKNNNWIHFIVAVLLMLASIETRSINLYLLPALLIPFLITNQKILYKIGLTTITLSAFFGATYLQNAHHSDYLRRTMADGLVRFEGNVASDKLLSSVSRTQTDWQTTFRREILTQVVEHPFELCKLYLAKFAKAWYATDSGENETTIFLLQIIHLLAFIILLLRYLIRKLRNPELGLLILIILYTNIIVMGTFSICRYVAPIAPLYIFCTVYLGDIIYRKYFKRRILTTELH